MLPAGFFKAANGTGPQGLLAMDTRCAWMVMRGAEFLLLFCHQVHVVEKSLQLAVGERQVLAQTVNLGVCKINKKELVVMRIPGRSKGVE